MDPKFVASLPGMSSPHLPAALTGWTLVRRKRNVGRLGGKTWYVSGGEWLESVVAGGEGCPCTGCEPVGAADWFHGACEGATTCTYHVHTYHKCTHEHTCTYIHSHAHTCTHIHSCSSHILPKLRYNAIGSGDLLRVCSSLLIWQQASKRLGWNQSWTFHKVIVG